MEAGAPEEIRQLIEIATLGTGLLEEAEEHRLVKVALARGLSPREAKDAIDAGLAACGARRAEKPVREPEVAPSPAPAPAPAPESPKKPVVPIPEDPVARVIARRMGKKNRPSSSVLTTSPLLSHDAPPPEEVIVPEVVAPPPAPAAPPAPEFVCTACLARVTSDELARGAAERLDDSRVHCRRCTSKLAAGLMCAACYRPVTRTQIDSGSAVARGDRAFHADCVLAPPPAAPPPPAASAPPRVATPAGGSAILGPIGKPPSGTLPALSSDQKLGAKCSGCYIALPSSYFTDGRAVVMDGKSWCQTCARRVGR